jgi:hypothetical protein
MAVEFATFANEVLTSLFKMWGGHWTKSQN